MTPAELERRATLLYGARWQTALARRIRVDDRSVRRWLAGERSVPAWLGAFLEVLERNPSER